MQDTESTAVLGGDPLIAPRRDERPPIEEIEAAMAGLTTRRHAILVHSETAALTLALRASGVQSGTDVAVSVLASAAVLRGIVEAGARPAYVGLDDHLGMALESAWPLIRRGRPRAIVVTAVCGIVPDLNAISRFAAEHHLTLIVAGGDSVPVCLGSRPLLAQGRVATVDLGHGSAVPVGGAAAAVLTDDDAVAATAARERDLLGLGAGSTYRWAEVSGILEDSPEGFAGRNRLALVREEISRQLELAARAGGLEPLPAGANLDPRPAGDVALHFDRDQWGGLPAEVLAEAIGRDLSCAHGALQPTAAEREAISIALSRSPLPLAGVPAVYLGQLPRDVIRLDERLRTDPRAPGALEASLRRIGRQLPAVRAWAAARPAAQH